MEYPLHYLYVMKTKDAIKVGSSADPEKRRKTLQSTCPYNLVLLFTVVFGHKELALTEERRIKSEHKDHHIRGEWFDFGVVDEILKAQNNECSIKWYTKNSLWMEPQWRDGIKEYDVDFLLTGTARIRVRAKTPKDALKEAIWLCDKGHIDPDQWKIDRPLEVIEKSLEELV